MSKGIQANPATCATCPCERNRSAIPRWSSTSMVRACRPPAREPARSWPARRSTMATSTPANASSPASISPVGPPPAITTGCSVMGTRRPDPSPPPPAFRSSRFGRFRPASGVIRHDPGLAASPPVAYTFEVERGRGPSAPPGPSGGTTAHASHCADVRVRRTIETVPFTLRNLREDLEDVGSRFDGSPDLEFRLATDALELEQSGLSFQRVPPGYRFPYGHTHKTQEEVYVVVRGSGRMKLDDEIVELREWDAVRVPPGTWRGYEAGPEGLEILVIGAPNLGEDPREDVEGRRDWWAD